MQSLNDICGGNCPGKGFDLGTPTLTTDRLEKASGLTWVDYVMNGWMGTKKRGRFLYCTGIPATSPLG